MSGSTSAWKLTTDKGEFAISTYIGIGGETGWLSGSITDPDGVSHQITGSARIERESGYRFGAHGVPQNTQTIRKVTVTGGDGIEVSAKNAKKAAEAFASEAAKSIVRAFEPRAEKAEQITITMSRAEWESVNNLLYNATWMGKASARAVSARSKVEDALR